MQPKSITIAGATFPWCWGMDVIVETQVNRKRLQPYPDGTERDEVAVSTTTTQTLRIHRPDAAMLNLADMAFEAGCRVGYSKTENVLTIELYQMPDGAYYRFNME